MNENIRRMIKVIVVATMVLIILLTAFGLDVSIYAKEQVKGDIVEKSIMSEDIKIEKVSLVRSIDKNEYSKEIIEKNDEFIYIKDIKMPIEHQKYLFKMCKERNLDYLKTLALLKHESQLNPFEVYKESYGYMQIHKVNHNRLSKELKTENKALDPYININWGTFMLNELYSMWRNEGISDKAISGSNFTTLDKYVFSSYNKGVAGFKKYGEATRYIGKVNDEYMFLSAAIAN